MTEWIKIHEKNDPFGEWIRANANLGAGATTPIITGAIAELQQIITQAKYIISSFIAFHSAGVDDILCGKKVADVDEVERTIALSKFLESSSVSKDVLLREDTIYHMPTRILIEHQPSKVGTATNNKSTMIGHQLMFYYVDRDVSLVSPKLKNQIALIEFSTTYGGASTPYYARKKHSKDTFLQLMNALGMQYVYANTLMSCMDDLADAVLQIFAYCKDKKLFARVIK